MLGKDRIVFEPTDYAEADNIGAYIRSSDGTLIDHVTIATVNRLAVDATMKDGAGNNITSTAGALDVNIKSPISVATDLNGIYNAGTNPIPDNVGIIISNRAAAGLANQTLQITGGSVALDAISPINVVAQDVNAFGMMWNGTSWDRVTGDATNGLKVAISNSTIAVTQSGTWTVGLSEDHNYGAVGATTLRTAAQVGNATGAADFNAGATGAQTLRVEANQGAPGASPWSVTSVTDSTLANAAATVGVTAAAITAALATRRKMILQNNSTTKAIYVGAVGVTTGNGLKIGPGSMLELELAASTALYAVSDVAGVPARVLETGHA